MRKRSIQILALLAGSALVIHLYVSQTFSFSGTDGEWFDLDYRPMGNDGHAAHEQHHEQGMGQKRPYPPPKRPPPGKGTSGGVGGDAAAVERTLLQADIRKRDAVVRAFQYAWSAYATDAFGYDEYHPMTHSGYNLGGGGGIGYTIVDAIDTMLLMDLKPEYAQAKKWVKEHLTFDRQGQFSTFETTIRVLGGLLSAYHLSGDNMYLTHATDLGERFLSVFDTSSGMPYSTVNLGGKSGGGSALSVSEVATLQLEFRYLAEASGREEFWRPVEKVMKLLAKARLPSALVPYGVSMYDGSFSQTTIRMGSNADSYYEYLLKQYLQTSQTEPVLRTMYADAMAGIRKYLLKTTPAKKLTYIAELKPSGGSSDWKAPDAWTPQPKQEHLACFLAGSLMLGATKVHRVDPTKPVSRPPLMTELTPTGQADWHAGVDILDGCMDTLNTATGLSPEGVTFRTKEQPGPKEFPERDWYINGAHQYQNPPYDARYMLRPEISESIFLAYRLTGVERYRATAWKLFSAIERYCKLPEGGYATVMDVDDINVTYDNKQETFFLSETLKYLFLTFADEAVLDLDRIVFNTEAHPLPVFVPNKVKPQFSEKEYVPTGMADD
ncbi:alpha-1,2-Mannosidase [Mycena indigotica]|uniref:alpha-1,2-Mannosidase n=1 Tax=Mycena indigotica TaxID=2126181 RepID=A0A8H6W3B9_9AGAR|nr:alpha-1,2-Mannosidase [Mycena indigotica]KAF7304079.1 alpha-1,2-Mannosidase [Mycena indigotica]